ncbi:MAG: hypothetical protein M0027_07680 [Candidatus Dormibacteraeota bacterium]|nr:hypothetical protein [Candidatus Dormibacteraeota bacterium]
MSRTDGAERQQRRPSAARDPKERWQCGAPPVAAITQTAEDGAGAADWDPCSWHGAKVGER